jgi:hypothetical protein
MKTMKFIYVAILLCAFSACKDSGDDLSTSNSSNTTNNTANSSNSTSNNTTNNTTTQTYPWNKVSTYIQYASDNTTESYKQLFEYDSQGREIGLKVYSEGSLSSVCRDYSYNGKEATFYMDDYTKGAVSSSYKMKKIFCDDNIRLKSYIQYASDNTTEYQKQIFDYDSQGREIGLKVYSEGALYSVYRDYTYNGKEVTYYMDYYKNGVVSSSFKMSEIFCDDNIRLKSYIRYASDNITEEYKQLYEYDSQGREVGSKVYFNGSLSTVSREYTYNGKEVTYYVDGYSNGTVSSSCKLKKIYYE